MLYKWVLLMIAGMISAASAESTGTGFADIAPTAPHADAITYLHSKDIITGYKDNTFRPERTVNRAEFAKVLAKLIAGPDDIRRCNREYAVPFSDVPRNAWFAEYICILAKMDFIKGYDDKTFRPSETINIAEAAKIVADAFHLETKSASLDKWYRPYIEALADRNVFPPDVEATGQALTRGVMAEMLYRLKEDKKVLPAADAEGLMASECDWFTADSIPRVDMQEVRRVWLQWINDARAGENLPPYIQNKQLHKTATLWSLEAKKTGSISHKRPGLTAYYDYKGIEKWFSKEDIDFANVNSTTFTENIGWGIFQCDKGDCTQSMIDAMRPTFDFYMGEKGKASRPHYNSIMKPEFRLLGMGMAVEPATKKFYITTHYGTAITSNPDPVCP